MMEPVGFADPVDVAGHCQSSVQLRRRTHCRAHPRERGTDGYAVTYYDLYSGQFLLVDPLVGVTIQPYEYAGDDPVNSADPSGLAKNGPQAKVINVSQTGPNTWFKLDSPYVYSGELTAIFADYDPGTLDFLTVSACTSNASLQVGSCQVQALTNAFGPLDNTGGLRLPEVSEGTYGQAFTYDIVANDVDLTQWNIDKEVETPIPIESEPPGASPPPPPANPRDEGPGGNEGDDGEGGEDDAAYSQGCSSLSTLAGYSGSGQGEPSPNSSGPIDFSVLLEWWGAPATSFSTQTFG